MGLTQLFQQADAIGRLVALLTLAMSVASWVVILWKGWVLWRAKADVGRAIAAFWQASDMVQAERHISQIDRERVVLPLVAAVQAPAHGTLAAGSTRAQQLTRGLRDGLHATLAKLQYGQVLLATVGSTAPFVGLLGTVWGIYHALLGIGGGGPVTIDSIAQPVGEALIMTAAGLAVAIPAVLAYNVFGKWIGMIEAELEGFALDVRELLGGDPTTAVEAH